MEINRVMMQCLTIESVRQPHSFWEIGVFTGKLECHWGSWSVTGKDNCLMWRVSDVLEEILCGHMKEAFANG